MRWWFALGLLAACQTSAGGVGDDDDTMPDAAGSGSGSGSGAKGVFDPATTRVVVEIDYETGQQPYTGTALGFGDTFAPTLTNIDRVFAHKKMLTIPTTAAEMELIGSIPDEELTVADLAAVANVHRQQHDAAGVKTYYIMFVSGHYVDNNGMVNDAVLGVSFGDTIAMFKDVIRTTSSITNSNSERYVEQSTLIHELSHSIGLVDNGVPMVAAHKDDAHGAHCNNDQCVMYWLNEGASEATTFAVNRLVTGSTILFDDACLADVDAKTGGL